MLPRPGGSGHVHWLGKLTYARVNQCERVARVHSADNTEGRANRISGYACNPPGRLDGPAEPPGHTRIYRDGRLRDQDALADYDIVPGNTTSPLRIGSVAMTAGGQRVRSGGGRASVDR
ncbi:hypothetical protein ACIQM3_16765 [Streptomyces sp. NPDC091271]|uniref:hypothetical protein n=1 Tax=Streptomyces sp. NPDC091271 TaxID=3365980 RepID=UPI003817E8E8